MPDEAVLDETAPVLGEMPEAAPGPGEALPVTAGAARAQESRGVLWLLVTAGTVLLLFGWLLPWFVEPTSSGVGFSPQDAVFGFTGVESITLAIVGICFLILLAGLVWDAVLGVRPRLAGLPPALVATLVLLYALGSFGVLEGLLDLVAASAGPGLLILLMSMAYLWAAGGLRARGGDVGVRSLLAVAGAGVVAAVLGFAGGYIVSAVGALLLSAALAATVTLGSRSRAYLSAGAGTAAATVAPGSRLPRALREHLAFARVRAIAAAAGAAATLVTWFIVQSQFSGQARPVSTLFGRLDGNASTDNAVWLTLSGFVIAGAAYALRGFVVRHPSVALAGVAFTFGALVPAIFSGPGSQAFVLFCAGSVGVYTLLALGLNVVVGFAGLLDLGYAAFFAIGAYTCAWLTSTQHGLARDTGFFLPFWVVLFVGAAIAALFGAVLGAPTLRLRGDYLAIVTLGFGEIIPDMANNNFFGQTGGPNGIQGILVIGAHNGPTLNVLEIGIAVLGVGMLMLVALRRLVRPGSSRLTVTAPAAGAIVAVVGAVIAVVGVVQLAAGSPWTYHFDQDPRPYFWTALVLIALVILGLRNLERSRLGRAWVAIREDEVAAAATGINTVSTKLLAFAIGATVSGFAGAFFGAVEGQVSPETFGFAVSVAALTTVVLGGIGNISGAAVGAMLVTFIIFWVLPNEAEWAGTLAKTTGVDTIGNFDISKYTYVVYGLILIGIMLLRPAGLLPSTARKIELAEGAQSEALSSVQGRS